MNSLILEQELAEACQAYGLLVEPHQQDLLLQWDRLPAETGQLLDQAGLARIPRSALSSPSDLASLLRRIEELAESQPGLFRLRPVEHPHSPATMPRSSAWLERYYGDMAFSPQNERKPAVIDHGRSRGPMIASIDSEPLVFFDASSQIATHSWGLNPPAVLESMALGRFGSDPIANPDPTDEVVDALDDFANALKVRTDGHFDHFAFANSGAEANEKALHIAQRSGRGGQKLLAFKGSFHGRTLLPLHGTWNPVKRTPFELTGFEACWLAYPRKLEPFAQASMPAGWISAWRTGKVKASEHWVEASAQMTPDEQSLFLEEVQILLEAEAQLSSEAIFAVLIEAMQGEGGDNHLSSRFLSALLAICRRHNVPMIIDEVQTGMGLSGDLFWFQAMNLEDENGNPDAPDLVSLAKKAQLGVILSRWPDPEPTEVQAASARRGLAYLEIYEATPTEQIAEFAARGLEGLAAALPEGLVTNVRGRGLAWAIDLPSGAVINRMLSERFWRGYLTYIAGQKTLRFRLNAAMDEVDWNRLMTALESSLQQMLDDVGHFDSPESFAAAVAELPPSPWQAQGTWKIPSSGLPEGFRLEEMSPPRVQELLDSMMILEADAYEPARRETPAGLAGFAELPGFIGHAIMTSNGELAAFSMGAALEGFPSVEGCNSDPTWGDGTSFYSLEMLTDSTFRGKGLGRALKVAQLNAAYEAGFDWIVGRNRVGGTREMGPLNRSLGAHLVQRLDNQYGEPEGQSDYYRIPIRPGAISIPDGDEFDGIDLAHGLQRPLGPRPTSLVSAAERGSLGGAIANKLSLCNFTTPDTIRFAETLQAVRPKGCDHALYTSGRDEMVDKGLRALKYNHQEGQVMLSLQGTYVGHTTAAARSLSWGRETYYQWPSLPHPAAVGTAAALAALDEALNTYEGRVLGLVCELFGEETGLRLNDEYLAELETRRQAGLKVCVVETSTGGYRGSADHCFLVDETPLQPSQVWWYTGGQLGIVFCADEAWVEKPLQLISTWDGDELSMIRCNHHLRAGFRLRENRIERSAQLASVISSLPGATHCGLQAFIPCDAPEDFAEELATAGLVVKERKTGISIVPALNVTEEELARGLDLLQRRLA